MSSNALGKRLNFEDEASSIDAILALACDDRGVLAIITGIEGPSYRPLGAMMALLPNDKRVGSLSSGCIDRDLHHQAQTVLETGRPQKLRYGLGSPFFDIKLPCGGGLDILLVPPPSLHFLQRAVALHEQRRAFYMDFNSTNGLVSVTLNKPDNNLHSSFVTLIRPEPQFLIFGKGAEAVIFAGLVNAALLPAVLFSNDYETITAATRRRISTQALHTAEVPRNIVIDGWTAAVLFFHEHEYEPPLLQMLLKTQVGYIGAQGSHKAHNTRTAALRSLGVSDNDIIRVRGPMGLIPAARDPRMLAVSVLAEALPIISSAVHK